VNVEKKINGSLSNAIDECCSTFATPPHIRQHAIRSLEDPRVGHARIGRHVANAAPDREVRVGNHVGRGIDRRPS